MHSKAIKIFFTALVNLASSKITSATDIMVDDAKTITTSGFEKDAILCRAASMRRIFVWKCCKHYKFCCHRITYQKDVTKIHHPRNFFDSSKIKTEMVGILLLLSQISAVRIVKCNLQGVD